MEKQFEIYHLAIGDVVIAESDGMLTDVFTTDYPTCEISGRQGPTELTAKAARQLGEYFAGNRKTFELPLAPRGTPFQTSVWEALLGIPYGQTRSYKEIAIAIGNPKAVRAVGMANHHNPISFIIPCHRVIGADGSLVGYGGGIDLKKRLLELERQVEANLEPKSRHS